MEPGPKARLILAMAPAAEDHSSDDHKERGGCRDCSSHNPHSGQQICKEQVGCPQRADLKAANREMGSGLGCGTPGSKRLPSLGSPDLQCARFGVEDW